MRALLSITVLACACCGASPVQGESDGPFARPVNIQEQPAPTEQQLEEQADYIIMTALDYKRLMRVVELLTHAVERQNDEIARLTVKLLGVKETCP